MDTNGIDLLGTLVIAGISFPISFLLARLCLRGVVRVVTASGSRERAIL